MILNPLEALEKGYISNLFDQEKQLQPNAWDWTVDGINYFDDFRGQTSTATPSFYVSERGKSMRPQSKLEPKELNGEQVWCLNANSQYDVFSDVYVNVPEGYAALLVLRSTFVRNGCWLASGIFDSKFSGHVGAVLHTGNAAAIIGVGTRLAQIMFLEADAAKAYAGGYNTAPGQHWTEKDGTKI